MREYTTQMDAARKGIVTPEIKAVAEKEHMTSRKKNVVGNKEPGYPEEGEKR